MSYFHMPNAIRPAVGVRTRAAVAWPTDVFPLVYWPLIVLILSVSVMVRVWNIAGTNLWSDEVITSIRAQGTLEEALESLYRVGNQAPFYYLVMQLLPNNSPFLMRVPSMLFGVLGVAFTIHVIWNLYQNRMMALWMGALLAVNPMHIILSRTARFYTLLFLVALVVIYCFIMLTRGKESRTIWAVFLFSSTVAYLTHYSALALPATQFLMIIYNWRQQRRLFFRWTIVQLVAGLPFLVWVALSLTQLKGTPYPVLPQNPHIQDIPISLMNVLIGYDGTFNWILLPGLTIAVMGFIFGAMHAISERRVNPELFYWLILSTAPIAVLFVMNYLTGVNYRDRYFLFLIPAVQLLFWYGWERDDYPVRQIALSAALITSLGLALNLFISGSYERTDWEDAGNFVADGLQPGDKILFERDIIYTAFSTYFPGDKSVLAQQSHILMNQSDTTPFEQDANRIWVVYRIRHEDFHRAGWVENLNPLTPNLSPISDWLLEHEEQIVFQQPFKGGVIYLLDPVESLAQQ